MLGTCFYFLINMSISGSFLILFLLVFRTIKGVPKPLVYSFWSIVFIRLMLPAAISNSISLYNYFGGIVKKLIPVGDLYDVNITATNYLNLATKYSPLEYKTQRMGQAFWLASAVWAVVALVVLLLVGVLYRAVSVQYKDSISIKENIYISDRVSSPFLLGIKSPKIILHSGIDMDSAQASHIIAHERVHMKRYDNLWRLLALVITCIHWFNPLVWVGLYYFLKDMELSCDQMVIESYDAVKRKEYASTLLLMTQSSNGQNPMFVNFGESDIKARVLNVLTYRKLLLLGIIFSIGFFVVMAIMLLTNPV